MIPKMLHEEAGHLCRAQASAGLNIPTLWAASEMIKPRTPKFVPGTVLMASCLYVLTAVIIIGKTNKKQDCTRRYMVPAAMVVQDGGNAALNGTGNGARRHMSGRESAGVVLETAVHV